MKSSHSNLTRRGFSLACAGALVSPAQDTPRTTVKPKDTGAALLNPDMGWFHYHFDEGAFPKDACLNDPPGSRGCTYGGRNRFDDTLDWFPGANVVYFRLAWSYLEPEEGKFNWQIIDEVANHWVAKGKQLAFRFTCYESTPRFATPRWVMEAGARGLYRSSRTGPYVPGDPAKSPWEPDYGDPIFLDKLDHFLAAAAARYDGRPEVAYIDIGSIGVWGEGHTPVLLPLSVRQKHVDLHLKHFKKTLVSVTDDFGNRFDEPQEPAVIYRRKFNYGVQLHFSHGYPYAKVPPKLPLIPEDKWGKSYTLKAGLTYPEAPDWRMQPVGYERDQAVVLGTLTISADGRPSFAPAKPAGDPKLAEYADFQVSAADLWTDHSYFRTLYVIPVAWSVLREFPQGVRPFFHFVNSEGSVAWAGVPWNIPEALEYALENGVGYRDDSLGYNSWKTVHSGWLHDYWQRRPVVIEGDHFFSGGSAPEWADRPLMYEKCVEDFHASFIGICWFPKEFLDTYPELVRKVNLRIGYRIQLVEASWPRAISGSSRVPFTAKWRNAGVAPCYGGGYPLVTLKSADGKVVATAVDRSLNIRDLLVGPENQAETRDQNAALDFPGSLRRGVYEAYISIVGPDGKPRIALPHEGSDGEKRYYLGEMNFA